MNGTRHREVGEYLARLERSMANLPAVRRDEILVEIDEHISELLAEKRSATDADVRNVLERVGDPDDIAAEASDRLGSIPIARPARPRTSWTDVTAVALLVLGTLTITPFYRPEATIVVWIAAVVLIWISEVWSIRDKVVVSLLLPAGALSAIFIQESGMRASFISRSSWSPRSGRPSGSVWSCDRHTVTSLGTLGWRPSHTDRYHPNHEMDDRRCPRCRRPCSDHPRAALDVWRGRPTPRWRRAGITPR
jgi:uncharacterized membrane protein